MSDHVIIPRVTSGHRSGGAFPHPPERPYLEPVTTLAAAALCTTRVRLGASVFILGHRHPVLMAKMLASIDALSEGRLIVGVGVGWWKEELEIRVFRWREGSGAAWPPEVDARAAALEGQVEARARPRRPSSKPALAPNPAIDVYALPRRCSRPRTP